MLSLGLPHAASSVASCGWMGMCAGGATGSALAPSRARHARPACRSRRADGGWGGGGLSLVGLGGALG